MSNTEVRSYPRRVMTEGGEIEFRHMTAADEAAVLASGAGEKYTSPYNNI